MDGQLEPRLAGLYIEAHTDLRRQRQQCRPQRKLIHTGKHRRRVRRHDVDTEAAVKGHDTRRGCLRLHAHAEFCAEKALFDVADRPICVRRGRAGRGLVFEVVVACVLHLRLLVTAEDEAAVIAQRQPQLPHTAHGIGGGQQPALVVGHAAPVEAAVVSQRHRVRLGVPAVALAHHVQMRQYIQHGRLIRREIGRAGIVIIVCHAKPVALAELKSQPQRLRRSVAKRQSVPCLTAHTAHCNEPSEVGGKFVPVSLCPRDDIFLHHNDHLMKKSLRIL